MADITTYPFVHHFRTRPTAHVLRYRKGRLVKDARGPTFWFRPLHTAIAEIPVDDRELPFLFHARSADFQELTVQGAVTFRVDAPDALAARVDFGIDLGTGFWTNAPLEQIAGLLTQLAQQIVVDDLARKPLRDILAAGVGPVRAAIASGLAAEPALDELGMTVTAVRVAALTPGNDVERDLGRPTREGISQQADEATFARRALAVEKERAIAENELQNQIELSRREETLVAQQGANDRRRAEENAAAERVRVTQKAEAVDVMEAARLRAERERAEIQTGVGTDVLLALALQELARRIGDVDQLVVTPDMLTPVLNRLATVGAAANGKEA